MWRGFAAIVALELVLLGGVIAGVLSSEPGSGIPAQRNIPVRQRSLPRQPVSVKITITPPARGGKSDVAFDTNPDRGRV
jgi:hypothetical protein